MEKIKIFISHAWEDNSIAAQLESKLKSIGVKVWVDYSNARAGATITSQVNKALEFCDTLVLLWSKSASKSKWIEHEWGAAFNSNKTITPCIIDDEKLPYLLTNTVHINFSKLDKGIMQLCNELILKTKIENLNTIDTESKIMKSIFNYLDEKFSVFICIFNILFLL